MNKAQIASYDSPVGHIQKIQQRPHYFTQVHDMPGRYTGNPGIEESTQFPGLDRFGAALFLRMISHKWFE